MLLYIYVTYSFLHFTYSTVKLVVLLSAYMLLMLRMAPKPLARLGGEIWSRIQNAQAHGGATHALHDIGPETML